MLRRGGWPISASVFLAALSSLLASLAGDVLPAFPFLWLALSIGPLLLGLPILSDLSRFLRHDEATEWVGALPARRSERTLARVLQLLAWLGVLALAWFVPWSLFAPPETSRAGRLGLVPAGFALALTLAAALLWCQQAFIRRHAWTLILLDTVWMALAVLGILQLLGHLPEIATLAPETGVVRWLPPTWLAQEWLGTVVVPVGTALLGCAGLVALALLPGVEPPSGPTQSLLERWIAPLRWLALRLWVRERERGAFDLVYLASPREREFALRIYPMIGIPLAFLWLAASGGSERWRSDVLALLLFTSAVSLPMVLVHLPLTESPQAAWIQIVSPCSDRARQEGALKAVFVRWIAPLYLALLVLGLGLGRAGEVLRLWPTALALALLSTRWLYPRCVRDLPLSRAPEDLRSSLGWTGTAMTMAATLTLAAVLANRFLDPLTGSLAALTLVGADRALERQTGPTPPAPYPSRVVDP
jgi:hypothetical protein